MATGTLVDVMDSSNLEFATDLGVDAILGWASAIYSIIKFAVAFIFQPVVLGAIVAVVALTMVGYKLYRKAMKKASGAMPK